MFSFDVCSMRSSIRRPAEYPADMNPTELRDVHVRQLPQTPALHGNMTASPVVGRNGSPGIPTMSDNDQYEPVRY